MARNRRRAERESNPSAGMRKAVKKAEKLTTDEPKKVGEGFTNVRGEHFSGDGTMYERGYGTIKRPAVEAASDETGEIRSYQAKGKLRNFDKNVGKAESRGKAFIDATAAGKLFEGR